MRKNKLVWVVRDGDKNLDEVIVCTGSEPTSSSRGYWHGGGDEVGICYKVFKKVIGLSLEIGKPMRVRFSVEAYKR